MSSFVLKMIACISMFTDHIGYIIFKGFSFFNYIGRLAFPIFAFQISEGYKNTKNLKKYLIRLLIFAIVSQIPFMLFRSLISDTFCLNIFFTLILGLISIIIYDKSKYKFFGVLFGIILGLIANFIHADYGFYGVAIILLFYIFKDNKINMSLSFIIATEIKYLITILQNSYCIEYVYLSIFTSLSILFISLYNGKKGLNIKYFLYLFYPLHLLLLYGIYIFTN